MVIAHTSQEQQASLCMNFCATAVTCMHGQGSSAKVPLLVAVCRLLGNLLVSLCIVSATGSTGMCRQGSSKDVGLLVAGFELLGNHRGSLCIRS